MNLATPVKYVKGVGPARAAVLETKGILTVEDLLAYAPFRYEDRSNLKPIAQLAPGEMATVIATVRTARLAGFRRRDLGMFEATFSDASGAVLAGKWFHAATWPTSSAPGQRIALYGKVEWDSHGGGLAMLHPEFEILSGEEDEGDASLHVGRVVPIYEAAGKITTRVFRRLLHTALQALAPVDDPLPEAVRRRLKLLDRWTALNRLHFPPQDEDLRLLNAFRSPAQFRMIFEEFFWLECGLALKRSAARKQAGIAFSPVGPGAGADQAHAPVQADRRAETRAGRDRPRHGRAPSHEPPAPGRRGQRQDPGGRRGRHHRHRERLPGGHAGAHRDPGDAALLLPEEAVRASGLHGCRCSRAPLTPARRRS